MTAAISRDIIIIGAGQNSLVAAFYLARAGHKPLVLEKRATVGGAAVTEEFHPGFHASVLEGVHGPLASEILRDMQLDEAHGFDCLEPKSRLCALSPDGRALLLTHKAPETAQRIAAFSAHDAAKYLELREVLHAAHGLVEDLLLMTPPDIDHPSSADAWNLLGAGRKFRRLGKKNMQRLIRWGPMAVADFVAEFFETELLRAAIASRGIFGVAAGPWSAGTTALLLLRSVAGFPDRVPPRFPSRVGGVSGALAAAAQQAGAEIRTNAEVARILVKDGAISGVALSSGEEISAKAVVSGADPKRTFLNLLEPVHLAPSFLQKMRNYRSSGVVARVHLALDALPTFPALQNLPEPERADALASRIHIGPEIDYLERAFDASKYGEFSRAPYLEASIPSLLDPSLACPDEGRASKHIMTIHMQYAPFKVNASTVASREASPVCHSEPARFSRSEESAFCVDDSRKGTAFYPEERRAAVPKTSQESGVLTPEVRSADNWENQRDALADAVIKTLAEYAPDLPSKILARRVITPLDLENDYALTGGHISHGELALDQLFTMRPLLGFARYQSPIRGLFLCGSGTHPGIGLTGASGLNASGEISRTLRR